MRLYPIKVRTDGNEESTIAYINPDHIVSVIQKGRDYTLTMSNGTIISLFFEDFLFLINTLESNGEDVGKI